MHRFEQMLATENADRKTPPIVLAPAPSTLIVLSGLVSFGPILCVVSFIYSIEQIYGIGLLLASIWIWLLVATIRIKIYDDHVERWVFWRKTWSLDRSAIYVESGFGGDLPIIPAVLFFDRKTSKKVGEILKPQFSRSDIEKLFSILKTN